MSVGTAALQLTDTCPNHPGIRVTGLRITDRPQYLLFVLLNCSFFNQERFSVLNNFSLQRKQWSFMLDNFFFLIKHVLHFCASRLLLPRQRIFLCFPSTKYKF
jgi:hypothetical protein